MKHRALKVRRNDPCPCGSGLKYKKCCMNRETILDAGQNRDLYCRKYNIRLKDEKDIEGIRRAGRLALRTLDLVGSHIRPGITTEEINTLVHEFTIQHGAIPAPLHYRGFPKSVCVSVNEVICHGIPGDRVLKDGDIVNVDVTPILKGYYADTNMTFFVGTPGPDAKKIVAVAAQCLKKGMSMVRPGNRFQTILGALGRNRLKQLLKRAFRVVRRPFFGGGLQILFKLSEHKPARFLHAAVQIDCPHNRFKRVSQRGRTASAAVLFFPFAQDQRFPQRQPGGAAAQGSAIDHPRPRLGQHALLDLRMSAVKLRGKDQLQDGVAQKFKPLIIAAAIILLLADRGMGHRLPEKVAVLKGHPNPFLKLFQRLLPAHESALSLAVCSGKGLSEGAWSALAASSDPKAPSRSKASGPRSSNAPTCC